MSFRRFLAGALMLLGLSPEASEAQQCTTVNFYGGLFHAGCISASDLNANNVAIYEAINATIITNWLPLSGGTLTGALIGTTATFDDLTTTPLNATQLTSGTVPDARLGITIGATTLTSGTSGRLLYDASGVLGEAAGLTFDGTSKITLGVAGTNVGGVVLKNATSGDITLSPVTGALGTVVASFPANTGTVAELNLSQSFTAGQAVTPVVLTPGTTVSVNAALGNNFTLTPVQNFTLANPTNLKAGQVLNFWISQDGTGSRLLTTGSEYQAAGSVSTLVLTTTALAKDLLQCISDTTLTLTCKLLLAISH